MKGIYDYFALRYGNPAKERELTQKLNSLQTQVNELEVRLRDALAVIERLEIENTEATNVLYELQSTIEAVDRRIDIVLGDTLSVTELSDGSLDISWNDNDPKYSFLSSLTEDEQREFFLNRIKEALEKYVN